jgi:hypothetical protein
VYRLSASPPWSSGLARKLHDDDANLGAALEEILANWTRVLTAQCY